MHFRSDRDPLEKSYLRAGIKKASKRDPKPLLEASHDHLLVTPPSHFTPQKV